MSILDLFEYQIIIIPFHPVNCSNGKAETSCSNHNSEKCVSCNFGYKLVNGLCVKNQCLCQFGAASRLCSESTSKSVKGIESNSGNCESCDFGYHLETNKSKNATYCVPNICTCEYGIQATGFKCAAQGVESCTECQPFYHLEQSNSKMVNSISQQTLICKENRYNCDYGQALPGSPEIAGTVFCTSCDDNYILNSQNDCAMSKMAKLYASKSESKIVTKLNQKSISLRNNNYWRLKNQANGNQMIFFGSSWKNNSTSNSKTDSNHNQQINKFQVKVLKPNFNDCIGWTTENTKTNPNRHCFELQNCICLFSETFLWSGIDQQLVEVENYEKWKVDDILIFEKIFYEASLRLNFYINGEMIWNKDYVNLDLQDGVDWKPNWKPTFSFENGSDFAYEIIGIE